MNTLAERIAAIADSITLYGTLWILVGVGLYLTIRTRGVQLRHFAHMVSVLGSSRKGSQGGISSFQAFTISLAARVGIGNVFGVAAALLMGGPGAIFWMWIVALVGMATAFFEATLAQIFKVRAEDGTFRGGPAYYILLGMKNPIMAKAFAIITVLTCAFVITSVQSNAIAETMVSSTSTSHVMVGALLVAFATPVIFGGIRSVAHVTEWMAPIMATLYVVVVAVIVVMNFSEFGSVLALIVTSAFSAEPLVGGLGGGILAAIINGTKRGLFSNEAGQGTAPNAAATATVAHPVRQGLIQSLGVFVDTVIVCTATAFVILIAGPEVWAAPNVNPANLTTLAIAHEVGQWAVIPMALMIFVLAFSSIIAAYVYSEVNMSFVTESPIALFIVRSVSVASIFIGCITALPIVWNSVDIAMAVMTITNLIALVVLAPWGIGALKDYDAQRKSGIADPVFQGHNNPHLPADLPSDVWRIPTSTTPSSE